MDFSMDVDMGMAPMTLFFAKAFGLYFLAVGLALFLNPDRFRSWYRDILAEDRRALFGGVISLVIGVFIIAAHNIWVMNWPVLITMIGWWGFIKGAALLSVPGFAKFFAPMIESDEMVFRGSGIAWFVVGLFLTYQGFFS